MTKSKLQLSNRLVDHFINAILIFLSVFMAFWLSEIRERKQEVEMTKRAKEAILTELNANLGVLERWTPYHRNIWEQGEAFLETGLDTIKTFSSLHIPGYDNGILREILTLNAWKLMDDPRVRFDVPTQMRINQIYEQHHYVINAIKSLTDDFFRQRELLDEAKTRENYVIFYRLIAELWGQESALMGRLKKGIESLEKT